VTRHHIDESHKLRRERDALRAALKEVCDDLECELQNIYHGTLDYPSQQRRFDRDMEVVRRARALLGGEYAGRSGAEDSSGSR